MTSATYRNDLSDWLSPFFGFVSDLFAGIREGREIATRYEALKRLSDRQLATIGLDRAAVPQAAVTSR